MTKRAYVISGSRVTHRDATVDDIEHAMARDPRDRINHLLESDDVSEAFILQTCNRSEVYVVTETTAQGREALAPINNPLPSDQTEIMGHEESLRHLLKVAAGLESQILGEDQILGQFRTAYKTATDLGAIGPVLEPALLKAIHVGERARTETGINEGIVSLGSAAIALATRERSLEDTTVLIIGAGEMATLVASALSDEPIGLLRVINRSPERAEQLTRELSVPTATHGLADLATYLPGADIVVSSTSSDSPVIDREMLAGAGETLLIDLAQPRDIDPDVATVPAVKLYDLDGLEAITEKTHQDRHESARRVESIVTEEYELLIQQYKRARADAVIAAMYTGAEQIKENEIARALSVGDFDAHEREILESLADSLVSQLMAVPTKSLRDAAADDDWDTISTAIELFDPHLDENGLRSLSTLFDAVNATTPADAIEDS